MKATNIMHVPYNQLQGKSKSNNLEQRMNNPNPVYWFSAQSLAIMLHLAANQPPWLQH